MAVQQLLNRQYEGLSTDDKPTGYAWRTTLAIVKLAKLNRRKVTT